MKRPRGGFTLIELVIVMVVITVLTVLGVAMLSGTQTQAEDSERDQDVKTIARSLEGYYVRGDPHITVNTQGTYPSSTELEYLLGKTGTYGSMYDPTSPSSDGYYGDVLPGLSLSAMTPPGASSPALEPGTAAVTNKYIYKPMARGSTALCTNPGDCSSYQLFYIDSSNTTHTIESKKK